MLDFQGFHRGLPLGFVVVITNHLDVNYQDGVLSMAAAKAVEHSFVLKCEAGCRPPVCWGSSANFMLSASALLSDVMKRHFLHALTPVSVRLPFSLYVSS